MGGSESKLKSLYNLNDLVMEGIFFNHFNATSKVSGEIVSVFKSKDGILNDNFDLLQNAIKKIKTIRHPGIIKYLKADFDKTEIYIVTENVTPLSSVLQKLGPDKICIGIHSLLKTVHFLHSNSIAHNNLSLSSIYVAQDGRWVLGGMEFIKVISDVNDEFIKVVDKFIPEESIPPEDVDKSLESTFTESRDYYALGNLISRIISPFISPSFIHSNDSEKLGWRELQDLLDNMLIRNPDSRYSTKLLLEASFFKDNVLIDVIETFQGLINIPVDIKVRMFSQLAMKLRCLSSYAVSEIVLPLILVLENFSEPGAESIFKELFGVEWNTKPASQTTVQRISFTNLQEDSKSPLISNEVYVQKVLPFIETALLTRRYEVRILCLRLIPCYIQQLFAWDPYFIQFLFEELLIGLDDIDDAIYVHSLQGLIYLIPFLIPKIKQNDSVDEKDDFLQNLKNQNTKRTVLNTILRNSTDKSSNKLTDLIQPALAVVENMIIPHILKLCVSEDEKTAYKWMVLDDLICLWKKLSIDVSKKNESSNVAQSILKCFQVIMRVMEPNDRIDFFCKRLCGGSTINDSESSAFIPKLVELGILFLNDENKHVRHEIGQTLIIIVTVISSEMDKTPVVSRKREKDSLKAKLRDYYQRLERLNNHFPRTGPRYSTSPLDSKSLNGNRGGKIYIEGPTWNEEWTDELDTFSDTNSDTHFQTHDHKDSEEPHTLKKSTSHLSNKSAPIKLSPSPNMKYLRENSSDIADIGLGDLGTWEMHEVSL